MLCLAYLQTIFHEIVFIRNENLGPMKSMVASQNNPLEQNISIEKHIYRMSSL